MRTLGHPSDDILVSTTFPLRHRYFDGIAKCEPNRDEARCPHRAERPLPSSAPVRLPLVSILDDDFGGRVPVPAKQHHLSVEPISPELALVDPALRQHVPSIRHTQEERTLAVVADVPPAITGALPPDAAARTWRRPSKSILAVGALAVVAGFAASTILGPRLLQDRLSSSGLKAAADGGAGRPARAVLPQRELTQAIRRVNLKISANRPLRWTPVRYATFYDVVLMRGSSRVLDFWPRKTELTLSTIRRRGGSDLRAGQYHWFVYPGFGRRRPRVSGSTIYGKLIARGVLTVPPRGSS